MVDANLTSAAEMNARPHSGEAGGGLTSAAAAVAYAGALPLLIAAILSWARMDDLAGPILPLMATYGITLLAFFGGVRWGVAVMSKPGPSFAQLAGAVVPVVMAVALLQFDNVVAILAALVIALPILLLDDLRATRRGSGAPEWYLGVRVPLTVMMELSFIAALALLLTHPGIVTA